MTESTDVLAVARKLADCADIDSLAQTVAINARAFAGADGATVVMERDGRCFYVGEDAIGALWKGQDFPMGSCLSGWAMTHREQVVVPDIRTDARIPQQLYRATFVRSLVMTPIVRGNVAVGAIGAYWAMHHIASRDELIALRAIAEAAAPGLLSMRAAASA